MFRGGRVDSRGTGIASGLSYNKGGTVQPRQNFIWGGVATGVGNVMKYGWRPAMKYGKKGLDWLLEPKGGFPMKIRGGAGGTMDKYVKQTMPPRTWGEFGKELGTSRAGEAGKFLWKDPAIRWPLKTVGGGAKGLWSLAKKPATAAGLGYGGYQFKDEIKDVWDKFSPWKEEPEEPLGISPGEARAMFGDDDLAAAMAGKSRAEAEELVKQLEATRLRKQKRKEEEDSLIDRINEANKPMSDDELMAEKERFAKILGKKEARKQGLYSDLMTWAGNLLDEGATVKGATGKTLKEIAQKKDPGLEIDQAAASMAINKFIKGEISKAEMEKLIAVNRVKLTDALTMGAKTGRAFIAENITATKRDGYPGVELGIRMSFPGKVPTKLKKEGDLTGTSADIELVEENIGEIFIESKSPYRVWTVTEDLQLEQLY